MKNGVRENKLMHKTYMSLKFIDLIQLDKKCEYSDDDILKKNHKLATSTFRYPCDSASGNASRPVGVDLPVKHAEPSDDSRLKYFKIFQSEAQQ